MLAVLLSLVVQITIATETLPVYLFNNPISNFIGTLDTDSVPAAVSHFLGDGQEPLTEANEGIFDFVASRFLDDKYSTVLLVHNFDESKAESVLGSASAGVDSSARAWLSERSEWVSPLGLEQEAELDGKIVKVNAIKEGVDYSDHIFDFLRSTKSRVMAIGVPKSSGFVKRAAPASSNSSSGVPAFFDSEESCVSQTKSCSNRGKCLKSSNGMYSCRCEATKQNDYTYYWGGNDCSKRDVSFQFNLIVGTTIAIIVAGALSVKLLFNLGSEPLPGILSTTAM